VLAITSPEALYDYVFFGFKGARNMHIDASADGLAYTDFNSVTRADVRCMVHPFRHTNTFLKPLACFELKRSF
jgi:hypothetical protein